MSPVVEQSRQYERLIAYYENAGPDYGEWSSGFNMHFGYYRPGLNPFRRETMLDEMNRQVLARLRLQPERDDLLIDLGCGVGATVRTAAAVFPRKRVLGITVVPWQVETGNAWNRRMGVFPRARLELLDYTASGLPAASVDGAVAIESACHAEGPDKLPFLREAARLLKPGARLSVADAFLKNPDRPLGPLSSRLNDLLNRSFVLPQLPQIERFADALARCGFDEISVEDISWRVAPSVMYAPYVVTSFVVKKWLRHQKLSEHTRANLRGSLMCSLLGINRVKFGYYLVSATRR
ncbi:MAG TPA: methyltransferase domain-containing protein [Vicinamibacterales bacterium]